jgi:hypothetical protein
MQVGKYVSDYKVSQPQKTKIFIVTIVRVSILA